MADGRIVLDIGEDRKRRFKSKLSLVGISMTDWLKSIIDKFIEENEVKE
jgi:hypothetical protein